jgi:NADH dehydrogenase
LRVVGDWVGNLVFGRDNVTLAAREEPRAYFQEFAARPKG